MLFSVAGAHYQEVLKQNFLSYFCFLIGHSVAHGDGAPRPYFGTPAKRAEHLEQNGHFLTGIAIREHPETPHIHPCAARQYLFSLHD